LVTKSEDSWEGPCEVVQRVSAVNYVIKLCYGRKKKRIVYIIMLKCYHERELEACALINVAEDQGLNDGLSKLKDELCERYKENDVLEILSEFTENMNEKPGRTAVVEMDI